MPTARLSEVFGVARRGFDQDGIRRIMALLVSHQRLFTAPDLDQRGSQLIFAPRRVWHPDDSPELKAPGFIRTAMEEHDRVGLATLSPLDRDPGLN